MKSLSYAHAKAVLGAILLAVLAIAPRSAHASSAAGDDATPAEARPLPKDYAQLDLTDEQKEKIFKVFDKFGPLIESQAEMAKAVAQGRDLPSMVAALRTLNALKANQKAALWKILTDDQLDKLKQIRAAAAPAKP